MGQEVSPRADLTLARSRLSQIESDLEVAAEFGKIASARFLELVGREPIIPAELSLNIPNVPAEPIALREIRSCSPTLNEKTNRIRQRQASVSVAKASILPQLSLQLSQNELTGSRAALVLRAQTGNGLSKFSNIERAQAELARATADLRQSEREVETLLRRQYVRFEAGIRGIDVSNNAVLSSTTLLDSYRRQFTAGRRSWLDVSNAMNEVLNSSIALNDNRFSALSAATRILLLTCRWRPYDGASI